MPLSISPDWITLAGTLAVALLLAGVGRLLDRCISCGAPDRSAPMAWLMLGWALALLTGALCALCGVSIFWPVAGLGVAGIAGYLVRPPRRPMAWLLFGWLIVAPLLLIASTIPPMMYDEFAQWLPNTRFLVDHGGFPDLANPNIWSAKAAYPPAIPVIGYGVQILVGRGWEEAAKIFAVLLAAGFGLILAELIRERVGNALALIVGVASATVINPFFDPRISLTAYADAPTGIALAFLVYTAWQALEKKGPGRIGLSIGAGVLLVLLRETNVVLVAGVVGALACTGRRGVFLSIAVAAGSLAAFLVWRSYVAAAAIPPALLPRALADWQWDAPWLVVRSLMTDRLGNHVALGGGILLLGAGAMVALKMHWQAFRPVRHLLLIGGVVSVMWTLFLLWAYVAVFSSEEIARAASAWRYLSQLGPMFLLVAFAMLPAAMPVAAKTSLVHPWASTAFVAVACVLPALLIFATRSHWQIDFQYPLKRRMHSVASIIAPIVGEKRITVIHPVDANEIAAELDYDLHRELGSSVPSPRLTRDEHTALILNVTGLEDSRCPRLLRWVGVELDDVTPTGLLQYCRGLGLASG